MKDFNLDLVVEFLKRRVQKTDIERYFDVCSRTARDIVSRTSHVKAVISYPQKAGYKIGTYDDLDELIITRNYLRRVIKETEKRLKPIEDLILEISLKDIKNNPSPISMEGM